MKVGIGWWRWQMVTTLERYKYQREANVCIDLSPHRQPFTILSIYSPLAKPSLERNNKIKITITAKSLSS